MPSRGFGAAGVCVFQLWIQEGTAASALDTSHPDSVAESFLNVGNVIVRVKTLPAHASRWLSHVVKTHERGTKSSIPVTCCPAPFERSLAPETDQ